MKQTKTLNPLLAQELRLLGTYLRQLRQKRRLTLVELSKRLVINPRTVSKIENGDPSVSFGTLINYLNILGLAKGIPERILGDFMIVIAERDNKPRFTDDELDF